MYLFLFNCFTGEKETTRYFALHFEEQLKIYKKQVRITLQSQKEEKEW